MDRCTWVQIYWRCGHIDLVIEAVQQFICQKCAGLFHYFTMSTTELTLNRHYLQEITESSADIECIMNEVGQMTAG